MIDLENRDRLPPRQHLIKQFPVLQYDRVMTIVRDNYKLTIGGEVENPIKSTLPELEKLQDINIIADIQVFIHLGYLMI